MTDNIIGTQCNERFCWRCLASYQRTGHAEGCLYGDPVFQWLTLALAGGVVAVGVMGVRRALAYLLP